MKFQKGHIESLTEDRYLKVERLEKKDKLGDSDGNPIQIWNTIMTWIWKDRGNWIVSKDLRSSNTKIGD